MDVAGTLVVFVVVLKRLGVEVGRVGRPVVHFVVAVVGLIFFAVVVAGLVDSVTYFT